jgi:hypothetical protein
VPYGEDGKHIPKQKGIYILELHVRLHKESLPFLLHK